MNKRKLRRVISLPMAMAQRHVRNLGPATSLIWSTSTLQGAENRGFAERLIGRWETTERTGAVFGGKMLP